MGYLTLGMPEGNSEELPKPRIEIVEKLYEKIDDVMVDFANDNEMSLMEMEMVLLFLRKKLDHHSIVTLMEFENKPDTEFIGSKELYR